MKTIAPPLGNSGNIGWHVLKSIRKLLMAPVGFLLGMLNPLLSSSKYSSSSKNLETKKKEDTLGDHSVPFADYSVTAVR